jgi:hypothetical protein
MVLARRFYRSFRIVLVALLLGLLSAGVLSTGVGYADEAKQRCSLATLHGTYLFGQQGLQVAGTDRIPIAVAGYEVYDGHGKVQGVATVSVNGTISRHVSYSGTYAVNKDCTGTLTTNANEHFDQFIAPDGSMFTFIKTDPGGVLTGFETQATAKRVGD